ncbi:sensor histidine kinase [Paenibacillus sp. 1011MAR3C5]|uniref:sensor histidine kinase n=1 Tax=Paenibacillus sp. 1011MAR3C5 TaxID=1675787 RepID=UPI000E6C644D|nr:HAMP domain-containing sensor histidine kinase [Paenibacillus sp. 1011MAR3C5]RJE86352.1 sensor histidine kinase [Paenibacillus sp. 1011MAR3C5]
MSIRLKLILAYLFGTLLTAIIVAMTGIGLVTAILSYLASGIVKDQSPHEAFSRSIDLFVDLRYAERYTPEDLTSPAFAASIGDRLQPFGGFLVVRQGESWESYGALSEGEAFLRQLRQDVSTIGPNADDMFVVSAWEERDLLSVGYDFPEIDSPLTYYLVADMTDAGSKTNRFELFVLLGIAILIGIILVPLLWITTRDIVRPLRQLEQGSRRIAEGDLNFRLESKVRNEVGSVIRSYEKMRSELQRSIDTQLALEENRKELISNISHDLKTPLTSIKGYVEGIRVGIANDPEKLKKYIDVIYAKTLDMDRMIDDLFLLSKLDLEQERFHLETVPLESFYRQTMSELQMEYESAGVRLTSEYEAGQNDVVTMDVQKMRRVMLNIVGNSVKFMDKKEPHIHVYFGRQSEDWVFAVTDNGPGMGPDELERIFDRFYRGDAFRNQNVAGSGLGLAIVKQIIANHGGTIYARSEPGQFMTVMISIPIKRDSNDARRA